MDGHIHVHSSSNSKEMASDYTDLTYDQINFKDYSKKCHIKASFIENNVLIKDKIISCNSLLNCNM